MGRIWDARADTPSRAVAAVRSAGEFSEGCCARRCVAAPRTRPRSDSARSCWRGSGANGTRLGWGSHNRSAFLGALRMVPNEVDRAVRKFCPHDAPQKIQNRFPGLVPHRQAQAMPAVRGASGQPLDGATASLAVRTAGGLPTPTPSAARYRLPRPHLVPANDHPVGGRVAIQRYTAVFFTANSGPPLAHQVCPEIDRLTREGM